MKKIAQILMHAFFAVLVFSGAAIAQKGSTNEKRIRFAARKTSATVRGLISDRNATDLYFVRLRAGQTVTVVFSSARKDVDVCVLAPENRDYCGQRRYSFKSQSNGDYQILVDGHRENIRYTLTVSVK
jgi:hypothetical protein